MELNLTNQPGERQQLLQALETFAHEHLLPPAVLQAADLALEELLTNILEHGFEPGQAAHIKVGFSLAPQFFIIQVTDNGRAFNPLESPAVDVSVPLEKKPIGGLGIHLIRKFMDELDYRREQDRNVFTMRKRLTSMKA